MDEAGAATDGCMVAARRVYDCPQLAALPNHAVRALVSYYRARDEEISGRVRTSAAVVTAFRPAVRPKAAACLHCGGEHLCGPAPLTCGQFCLPFDVMPCKHQHLHCYRSLSFRVLGFLGFLVWHAGCGMGVVHSICAAVCLPACSPAFSLSRDRTSFCLESGMEH